MSCEVWVLLYSSLPPLPVYHLISVTHELQTMHVLSTVTVLRNDCQMSPESHVKIKKHAHRLQA